MTNFPLFKFVPFRFYCFYESIVAQYVRLYIKASTWKYLGLEAMQDMWKDRQLPGKVIGITPSAISDNILLSTDLDVLDSSMLHCKGAEIASWLHENNMQEVPYVIIDDEYVILESQLPHFILTNPYDGIIEELAMRAIGILNRQ